MGLSLAAITASTLVARVLSPRLGEADSLDFAFGKASPKDVALTVKPVAEVTPNVFLVEFNSFNNLKLVLRLRPWFFNIRVIVMVMMKNGDCPSSVHLS